MANNLYVKNAGTWKVPVNVGVKTGGVWKTPTGVFVKVSGAWQKVWPTVDATKVLDLDFTTGVLPAVNFTYTRSMGATYIDSAGIMRMGAHNLLNFSEDFGQASWTKVSSATVTVNQINSPTGVLTADMLNHTVAGTVVGGGVSKNATTTNSLSILSVYAKAGTKNFVVIGNTSTPDATQCWFNLSTGAVGTRGSAFSSSGISDAGGGWWRCWCATNAVSTLIRIGVAETNGVTTCTSTGNIYIWGAQAETPLVNTAPTTYVPTLTSSDGAIPRFDYHPVTKAIRGLLLEQVRNNQALNSRTFETSYTKAGLTATSNQTTSPDGTVDAPLLTASASPSTIYQAIANVTDYALSVYAKKGTTDWFYLVGVITGAAPAQPKAWFNLNTGAVGTVEAPLANAGIEDAGNGWYRCWVTRAFTSDTEGWMAGISDANSSAAVTVGKTIYLWGPQSEAYNVGQMPAPTSYIPSGTAGINRNGDNLRLSGVDFSSWYTAAAGTLVAAFVPRNILGTRTAVSINDNTTAHGMTLASVSAVGRASVVAASAAQADIGSSAITLNATNKIAFAFAANDFAVSANGGTVGTDTAGTVPTVNRLGFGEDTLISGGAATLNGCLRSVQFYNVRKSNAELQALST